MKSGRRSPNGSIEGRGEKRLKRRKKEKIKLAWRVKKEREQIQKRGGGEREEDGVEKIERKGC